jgi:P27 family predicted phage terminase small subunit
MSDSSTPEFPEPNWESLFSSSAEIVSAGDYWAMLTAELRDRGLLAQANAHSLQRLVRTYLIYDDMAAEVAKNGAVAKPKRGNPKAILRVSPFFTAMRDAGNDAANIEAELGLSPRRRSGVTKAERRSRVTRPSDEFIKPKSA